MKRVNIICEGQTEENFVTQLLAPHLIDFGVIATPHNLGTGTNYQKLRKKVLEWLKAEPTAHVTTLIDLYAMPDDFPGFDEHIHKQPQDKVEGLEADFKADIERENIENWRFIPHFQLHEFEALLFSDPKIMEDWFGMDTKIPANAFNNILEQYSGPEAINSDREKAPSKQIIKILPAYKKGKPTLGMVVASEIGLSKMRQTCPHFNAWLTKLEQL